MSKTFDAEVRDRDWLMTTANMVGCAFPVRLLASLRTNEFGRCGWANWWTYDGMNRLWVMLPGSEVVRGIVEFGLAGMSR